MLNPSFARQAIGRSHRMGQEHPVTVTRLLMKGAVEGWRLLLCLVWTALELRAVVQHPCLRHSRSCALHGPPCCPLAARNWGNSALPAWPSLLHSLGRPLLAAGTIEEKIAAFAARWEPEGVS